jgi:hypothetical protein
LFGFFWKNGVWFTNSITCTLVEQFDPWVVFSLLCPAAVSGWGAGLLPNDILFCPSTLKGLILFLGATEDSGISPDSLSVRGAGLPSCLKWGQQGQWLI